MISREFRFGIAALIFVLDRLSKYWIEQNVSAWDTFVVIPSFFNIVHTQNRGTAFGFMNYSDSTWRVFLLTGVASVVMAIIGMQLWRLPKGGWPGGSGVAVAMALILGGAAGNLF